MTRSSKRILISGFEIGGQMQLLAETLRKRWIPATAVAYNADFRGYQNDVMLAGKGLRANLSRLFFFFWALVHYDVFHFFWGHSMLNFWKFHLLDVPLLRLFGKKVIVHFRGLDVVDIRYFDYKRALARGEASHPPAMSRPEQLRKLKVWERWASHILVSEPDLHFVSKRSVLSPQVIDLNYWKSEAIPLSQKDGIIRLVHAPSSRRKKGTDFIEQAIKELQEEGLNIELLMAEKLPHDRILELYAQADIGIDQVLYGWHGKVSVELMALGKPVICNIDPELRKYRPDLPIVHAAPTNLKQVIKELSYNKELRERLGRESVKYVQIYHDVEKVVDDLLAFYNLNYKTLQKNEIPDAKTW